MDKELDVLTTDSGQQSFTYRSCDNYKDDGKRIISFCKSMTSHTKNNKEYYKNYINSLLSQYCVKLTKEVADSYIPVLDLISKHKPYLTSKVEDFKNEIYNVSYVTDDFGKWHPVNKLNTNYLDISELITHMVKKFFTNKSTDTFFSKILNKDVAYKFLSEYVGNDEFILSLKNRFDGNSHLSIDQLLGLSSTMSDIINHEFFIKEGFEKIFSKRVPLTLDEIKKFISNNVKNSHDGEIVEDFIESVLKGYGWKIIHKGGNGDFIDMKFGIDLIIEKNNVIKFVQSKKVWEIKHLVENCIKINDGIGSYFVTGKVTDVREDTIDLIALGTMDGRYIISESQNEVIESKNVNGVTEYRYSGKKSLPSPKFGSCVVSQPFENMIKI